MSMVVDYISPLNPLMCYAKCEDSFDYQKLIVTKCNHIFCRACLAQWGGLNQKKGIELTCPVDNKVLSLITDENVRQKDEDPEIDQTALAEGMQYTSFKLHLERFIYYIQNDFSTLEKTLIAKSVRAISSCGILKGKLKLDSQESNEDRCSVCLATIPQMSFIVEDKDLTRVGHFIHKECLQAVKIDNESQILDISIDNMVKVAAQLPSPKVLPKEPYKPPSPAKVFFVAIIFPISLWALAMNRRIYHNQSFVLFVLSIPALFFLKILALVLNGLKAAFNAKHA